MERVGEIRGRGVLEFTPNFQKEFVGNARSFWEESPFVVEKEFIQGDSYLLLGKYKK